jgi:hypothetical protein
MTDHSFKYGQPRFVDVDRHLSTFAARFRLGSGDLASRPTDQSDVLFPKEAQAACHRQRRDRRENRTASIGFNNFKQMLDRPSHNIASHIFSGTCAAPLRSETST